MAGVVMGMSHQAKDFLSRRSLLDAYLGGEFELLSDSRAYDLEFRLRMDAEYLIGRDVAPYHSHPMLNPESGPCGVYSCACVSAAGGAPLAGIPAAEPLAHDPELFPVFFQAGVVAPPEGPDFGNRVVFIGEQEDYMPQWRFEESQLMSGDR